MIQIFSSLVADSASSGGSQSISPSAYSLWSILFTCGKVVGGLLLTFTTLLYFNQEKLLYFPYPPGMPRTPEESPFGSASPSQWRKDGRPVSTPDTTATIPFEEKIISTPDGESLHTWLLLQDNAEERPTLIYFHGNAGHMGFRLQNAADMYAKVKINILMMDYRGYGKSTGNPSERGLQIDAVAVLRYVRSHPRLRNSPVVAFGRSLGGAVAVHLANELPTDVAGLILENTFLSINSMVDIVMPIIKPIKNYVLKIKWNSDITIKALKQPIMFISGDSDELVPPSHMKMLYELATSAAHRDFYSVSGGTHNDSWHRGGNKYYERMRKFMEVIDQRAKGPEKECLSEPSPALKEDASSDAHVASSSDQEDEEGLGVLVGAHIPTMDSKFKVR